MLIQGCLPIPACSPIADVQGLTIGRAGAHVHQAEGVPGPMLPGTLKGDGLMMPSKGGLPYLPFMGPSSRHPAPVADVQRLTIGRAGAHVH